MVKNINKQRLINILIAKVNVKLSNMVPPLAYHTTILKSFIVYANRRSETKRVRLHVN